jgi:hypothetical protein
LRPPKLDLEARSVGAVGYRTRRATNVSLITAGHPTSRGRSTSQASQGFNPGRAGETKVCGLLRSKVLQQQVELFLAAVDMLRISQFAVRSLGRALGCGISGDSHRPR